ncbi:hypothetical protein L596_001690 [Steinernema carpocapsae]|uniref:FAD dependent oxidoreductase domain-containing protein n=1 Tax=Steinernema carpocapsae TaxID=34508 RepID=A0A4U8UP02_STECR|nr:hypothetical protein L596_001690 [Steinernema carpocapsae]
MTKLHEVVIVGSGIMGSCTAYHSARAKLSPLVLEQFEKGHHKGSSHGKSRIIRYSHGYPTYLPIMTESYRLWDELAKESRERLVNKCGLLRISDEKTAHANAKILIDGGLPNRILTGRQIREEFPQFHYDDSWFGMLDPEGGIIYADKCLEAAQEQATKQGAVFKFGEKVTDIKSESDHVVVVTNKDTYSTKSLVVTAGGWLSKVLPEMDNLVHTQAEQIGTYYWKVKSNPDRYDADKQCPTIVIETKDSKMFMVPPVDYPGQIKLCIDACEAIDPNNPLTEMPQWMEDYLKGHIAKHLPDIDASAASKIDMCIYTMTKDHHYAIGRFPSDPRILVGGGFSGTGLKLAISVGRMLTDLVRGADERTTIPELFSLTRKRVRGN